MRITIIGIGNILLKDEGVGVHAIRALGKKYIFTPSVRIIDGGTMGLDLLPYVEETDALLLIDAVDFNAEPGFVKTIEDSNIKTFMDLKFSVHQIGLPDMLSATALMGNTPEKICLVGIQPDKLDMGLELTPKVEAAFQELIDTSLDKLRSWGVEVE